MEIEYEEGRLTNLKNTIESLSNNTLDPIQTFTATRKYNGDIIIHNKTL